MTCHISNMPLPFLLILMLLCAQTPLARHLKGRQLKRRLVTKRPKRDLKVFVYDLPKKWSADTIVNQLETYKDQYWSKSNCGWNRHVCRESEWHREYSTFRQYGAGVSIIEKFKNYDNLVTDPKKADILVVPYPHGSQCRAPPHGENWAHCGGVDRGYTKELVRWLPYFNPETKKRHFWLLTNDLGNNHEHLEDMPLYATLGGIPNVYGNHAVPAGVTNIVVPPPVTEPEYQPSALAATNWTRPRKYSVYMNAGLVSAERREVDQILNRMSSVGGLPTIHTVIEGHRSFPLPPSKIWENYRNTVFCPVVKGDLPFQKRFYDVTLSGCLPVVLKRTSRTQKDTGCHSWFADWQPSYVDTHPFARAGRPARRGASINYRDFVVEIEGGVHNMIPTLEKIMADKSKLHAMQTALGKHAHKLVYGLDEDINAEGDAFDQLLGNLQYYVKYHLAGKPDPKISCF